MLLFLQFCSCKLWSGPKSGKVHKESLIILTVFTAVPPIMTNATLKMENRD